MFKKHERSDQIGSIFILFIYIFLAVLLTKLNYIYIIIIYIEKKIWYYHLSYVNKQKENKTKNLKQIIIKKNLFRKSERERREKK